MSDAPTQRFDVQPPANSDQNPRRSRLPLILGIIGGALLIAVIVLLVLLLGKGSPSATAGGTDSPTPSDSSSPSSTPIPTPTVTVTVTPEPSAGGGGSGAPEKPNGNNVLITQFTISPSSISCSAGQTQLHITWKSVNGYQAYFGVNTIDAQAAGMGWDLPTSGSDHDFGKFGSYPYKVSCTTPPNSYSLTVVGNGSRQTLTIPLKQTH